MSAVLESAPSLGTPPLRSGDFLSPGEFMRRWANQHRIKFAELLKGIVYMPSPVSIEHGEMENLVGTWIGTYRAATPGAGSGNNATTYLGDDIPQPDVHLRVLPEYGGRSWIDDGYLHGSPELIVEVCASSAAYDLHVKFDLYQEAGVQEYLAVVIHEREVRWHMLDAGAYRRLSPDADGVLRSRALPGLWLDGGAMLDVNFARVLKTLRDGLESPEHAKFVKDLASRKQP